jgi:hypothetical protein
MMDDLQLMIGGRQNSLKFTEDENLLTADLLLPLCREAHELASIFIKTRKTAQSKGL